MTTQGPYRIVDEPTEQKFLLYFGDYTVAEFAYGEHAKGVVRPHADRACELLNARKNRELVAAERGNAEELRKARLYLKGCMGHFYEETPVSKIAMDVAAEFHRGRIREQEQRDRLDEARQRAERAEAECERLRGLLSRWTGSPKVTMALPNGEYESCKVLDVSHSECGIMVEAPAALSPAPAAHKEKA